MFKQYRVFSNMYGSWQYEGSFSARSRMTAHRSWFIAGDELTEYAMAFAPPANATRLLVTCGQMAQEIPINR